MEKIEENSKKNLNILYIDKKRSILEKMYREFSGNEILNLSSTTRTEPKEGFPILELSVKNPDGTSKKWLPYEKALKTYGIEAVNLRRILPNEIDLDCDDVNVKEIIEKLNKMRISYEWWSTTPSTPYEHAHIRFRIKDLEKLTPKQRTIAKRKLILNFRDSNFKTPDPVSAYPCRMVSIEWSKHHKRDEYLELIKKVDEGEIKLTEEFIKEIKKEAEEVKEFREKYVSPIRVKWKCPLIEKILKFGNKNKSGTHRFTWVISAYLNNQGKSLKETQEILREWNEKNIKPEPDSQIINQSRTVYENDIVHISCEWLKKQGLCDKKECKFQEKNMAAFLELIKAPEKWEEETSDELPILTDDERPKPIIKNIAKNLMREHSFISTGTGMERYTLYVYNNGIYHDNGINFISKKVQEMTDGNITNNQLNEILGQIRRLTDIDRSEINKSSNFIHLQNGIYDLEKGVLLPFDEKIISTIQLPIFYDSKADCPLFKKFLEEMLGKEQTNLIQEIFGYLLTKHQKYKKAFIFYGPKDTGKTTLINVIINFLGEKNTTNFQIQSLLNHNFALKELYSSLANISDDLPSKKIHNTGLFKAMTGDGYVHADVKFKDGFDFKPFTKHIYACNDLPVAEEGDDVFFDRFICVKFGNVIPEYAQDKTLLEKMVTKEELSGIFNWALKGLKRLMTQKIFTQTKFNRDVKEQWIIQSSPLRVFVEKYIEYDVDSFITKNDFLSGLNEFCKNNEAAPVTAQKVGQKLPLILPKIKTVNPLVGKKQIHSWSGIRFNKKFKEEFGYLELQSQRNTETHPTPTIKKFISSENFDGRIEKILSEIPKEGISYQYLVDWITTEYNIPDFEAEKIIENLKKEGLIFVPHHGFIMKT